MSSNAFAETVSRERFTLVLRFYIHTNCNIIPPKQPSNRLKFIGFSRVNTSENVLVSLFADPLDDYLIGGRKSSHLQMMIEEFSVRFYHWVKSWTWNNWKKFVAKSEGCKFNEIVVVSRVPCSVSAGMEFLNHAVHSTAIYMEQFTFHFIAREP